MCVCIGGGGGGEGGGRADGVKTGLVLSRGCTGFVYNLEESELDANILNNHSLNSICCLPRSKIEGVSSTPQVSAHGTCLEVLIVSCSIIC
jgi:hypothetical protein